MLDLKFIRDNVEAVTANVERRGVKNADPKRVVELYQERNEKLQLLEALRAERGEAGNRRRGADDGRHHRCATRAESCGPSRRCAALRRRA